VRVCVKLLALYNAMGSLANAGSAICLLLMIVCTAQATHCTRKVLNAFDADYECPRPGDNWDKTYCCGDPRQERCCNEEDMREIATIVSAVEQTVPYIAAIFLLIVLGSITCCVCHDRKKRRQRQLQADAANVHITVENPQPTNFSPYPLLADQKSSGQGYERM